MADQKLYFDQNDKLVFDDRISPNPLVMLSPTGAAPNPVPLDGCILYIDSTDSSSYPGSGSVVYDLSGNDNDGTMNNVTYTGNSFYMSGNTSNITFGSGSEWDVGDTWSYVVWFKNVSSASGYIMEKSNAFDVLSLVWGYAGEAVNVWNGGYNSMDPVSCPLSEGWHMVAFTKDTNGTPNNYKSYKNGTNITTVSSDWTVGSDTTGFVIAPSWQPLAFYISRVLVYTRALTSAEITAINNYFSIDPS